jgi:hypothetical protein
MPRPMIIGMSPSSAYRDRAWHESAKSTQFLARIIFGGEDRIPELKRLFDMRNLNRYTPEVQAGFAKYDAKEAQACLASLERDNELSHRLIVLLGDRVAKSFGSFTGTNVLQRRNRFVDVHNYDKDIDCRVLFVHHPGYFVTKRGRKTAQALAEIARARSELEAPFADVLGIARQEDQIAELQRLADKREELIAAEFDTWLSNEESDRADEEDRLFGAGSSGSDDRENDDDGLSNEFDRYERLIDGGWEED